MIILISGTINVGKTACARLLRKKIPKVEIVEPDSYFKLFSGVDIGVAGNKCLKMASNRAAILSRAGKNVIMPYPLSRDSYRKVVKDLRDDNDIHYITLTARPSILIGKRSKRDNPKWEQQVINWHKELGVLDPADGIVIDTSDITLEETVSQIMQAIEAKKSLVQTKALYVQV